MVKRIYYDNNNNDPNYNRGGGKPDKYHHNNKNGISNNNNNTLSKTESLTCRLDKNLLNTLKNEAEQKEVSVNTLINQILRNHSDWHSNAAKAGFIPVRRSLMTKLMERISEEDITNIAEHVVKKDTKDILLMLRGEYNIESALDFIETQLRISGYPYRHEVVNYEQHHYAIKHEMGIKWSLYLKELFRFIFGEFGLGRVVFDVRDNTLSFTVDTHSLI